MDWKKLLREQEANAAYLLSNMQKAAGLDLFHVFGSLWDCPKSPIGLCAYHEIEDRMHDQCVFCGDPEERK